MKLKRVGNKFKIVDIQKSKKEVNLEMQTKSRYEVIAELEQKKRDLIRQKAQLDDVAEKKKRDIKLQQRKLDDLKDDLEYFEKSLDEKKVMIDELIKSTEDSLNRFNALQKTQ